MADAALMGFEAAEVLPDDRHAYGEARFRAYGPIDGRMHVLAFTMGDGTLRAISRRKANT